MIRRLPPRPILRPIAAAGLSLVLIGGLAGCGDDDDTADDTTTEQAETTVADEGTEGTEGTEERRYPGHNRQLQFPKTHGASMLLGTATAGSALTSARPRRPRCPRWFNGRTTALNHGGHGEHGGTALASALQAVCRSQNNRASECCWELQQPVVPW